MLRELTRVAIAGLIGACLVTGWVVIRIEQQGQRDERRPADAIVVLGAAQYDGKPSATFAARLDHAVSLYLSGLAKILVVTGGKLPGDRTTEAATARAWAIARGVPASAILYEDKGRTTYESMQGVAAVFREHGLTSAVFVSDRTHMLRVLRMATDQGIVAWGSPTRTSPMDLDPGLRMRSTVHEVLGVIAYFLGGDRLVDDTGGVASAPSREARRQSLRRPVRWPGFRPSDTGIRARRRPFSRPTPLAGALREPILAPISRAVRTPPARPSRPRDTHAARTRTAPHRAHRA